MPPQPDPLPVPTLIPFPTPPAPPLFMGTVPVGDIIGVAMVVLYIVLLFFLLTGIYSHCVTITRSAQRQKRTPPTDT